MHAQDIDFFRQLKQRADRRRAWLEKTLGVGRGALTFPAYTPDLSPTILDVEVPAYPRAIPRLPPKSLFAPDPRLGQDVLFCPALRLSRKGIDRTKAESETSHSAVAADILVHSRASRAVDSRPAEVPGDGDVSMAYLQACSAIGQPLLGFTRSCRTLLGCEIQEGENFVATLSQLGRWK